MTAGDENGLDTAASAHGYQWCPITDLRSRLLITTNKDALSAAYSRLVQQHAQVTSYPETARVG